MLYTTCNRCTKRLMRNLPHARIVALIAVGGLIGGCGSASEDTAEEFDTSEEALVTATWVRTDNMAAIVHSDSQVPVCRTMVGNYYIAGKRVNGRCYYGLNGNEGWSYVWQDLINNQPYQWIQWPGYVPWNMVTAGTTIYGDGTGVCEGYYRGWQPGKFNYADNSCYITWSGGEYKNTNFRILVKQ